MAKNPSQTFHGIPLFCAMTSILFIVPRSRMRVESKVSFILSARAELSRISSPIALVICRCQRQIPFSNTPYRDRDAYIFQHPHLAQYTSHLRVILAF